MLHRHALSDAAWERLKDRCPGWIWTTSGSISTGAVC